MEKLVPLCRVDGIVKCTATTENSLEVPHKKLKSRNSRRVLMEVTIHFWVHKRCLYTHTHVFTAALYTIDEMTATKISIDG